MRAFRCKQPASGEGGFTLIEALIVIAIFSIGILGAMGMQVAAINTNASSRKVTMALAYAGDTMEQLMRIGGGSEDLFNVDDDGLNGVDDLNESEFQSDSVDNDRDGGTDEADELEWHRMSAFQVGTGRVRGTEIPVNAYYASIFNLSWDVTNVDTNGDGNADAKRIDITVTWENGKRHVSLTNMRNNIY